MTGCQIRYLRHRFGARKPVWRVNQYVQIYAAFCIGLWATFPKILASCLFKTHYLHSPSLVGLLQPIQLSQSQNCCAELFTKVKGNRNDIYSESTCISQSITYMYLYISSLMKLKAYTRSASLGNSVPHPNLIAVTRHVPPTHRARDFVDLGWEQ
jgi:hypothetical protein